MVRYLVVHPERLLQFKLERVFVFVYQKPKREEGRSTEGSKTAVSLVILTGGAQMNVRKGRFDLALRVTRFDLALRVTNSSNSS